MREKVKSCFCGFCVIEESVQILACGDDMDIIGKTQGTTKETLISLEKAAENMHLQMNQGKTKYMPVT
jgi:hypothetical protein